MYVFLTLTRILLDTLVGVPEAAIAIATTSRGVNTCKNTNLRPNSFSYDTPFKALLFDLCPHM